MRLRSAVGYDTWASMPLGESDSLSDLALSVSCASIVDAHFLAIIGPEREPDMTETGGGRRGRTSGLEELEEPGGCSVKRGLG